MISIIIPSHNNLRHLKNAYTSIRKHAPYAEIVLLDDASIDGTWEWMNQLQDDNIILYKTEERTGHTILYDIGIHFATQDIVGIFHADMIMGPNYINNILKHLKPSVVVCGTRIEPPLHPEGKEKIIKDFGIDFDTLKIEDFEKYVETMQLYDYNKTTKGMFAPWVIYKEDFIKAGGHDALFAPFPYEDSDLFQRWILKGYEFIQSRDAYVYHLTCRGHRWTQQIGQNDNYFELAENRSKRNYLRKWGSWIKNDEYQHPILSPRYNIGIKVIGGNTYTLEWLEPWFDQIRVDHDYSDYILYEQDNTPYDLVNKIADLSVPLNTDIEVTITDAMFMNPGSYSTIQSLQNIIDGISLVESNVFDLGNNISVKINQRINRINDCIEPVIKNEF